MVICPTGLQLSFPQSRYLSGPTKRSNVHTITATYMHLLTQPDVHSLHTSRGIRHLQGTNKMYIHIRKKQSFSHNKLKEDVNCNQYRTTSCFHLLGIQNNWREAAAKNPAMAARHHHNSSGLPSPSQWVCELLTQSVPSSCYVSLNTGSQLKER